MLKLFLWANKIDWKFSAFTFKSGNTFQITLIDIPYCITYSVYYPNVWSIIWKAILVSAQLEG